MSTVAIDEFRAHVDKYLAAAAKQEVILTHDGKPWLVLRAIASEGNEDSSAFAQSRAFWEMIHERRQEQGIPWEEAQKELGLEQKESDS